MITKKQLGLLRNLFSPSAPQWVSIYFTRKCNLKCGYCKVPLIKKPELSINEWCKVIDKLKTFKVQAIDIVGGEPTLREDLPQLIYHINQNEMVSSVHSNFYHIQKKYIDILIENGLDVLKASLDGYRHNASVKTNVSKVLDTLDYAKNSILTYVSCVITSQNIEDVIPLAEEVVSHGIMFTCGIYQDVNGLFSKRDPQLYPDWQKVQETMAKLGEIKKRTKLIRNSSVFVNKATTQFSYQNRWKCNPSLDSWLIVDCDGMLMRCQEYDSKISIFDLENLKDPRWIQYKRETVEACKGCLYHCYFDAENVRGISLLKEIPVLMKISRHFR